MAAVDLLQNYGPDKSQSAGHCQGGCQDASCNEDHESGAKRGVTIFDVIKAGMLIPVQTFVETEGDEILATRDDKGHTPAHWACLGGHITILRYMLEHKAPIDEPSDNDLAQCPIHWACVNGHIAVVDLLLQRGVNIDVVDKKGCSPLVVACQYGKTMLAGYLMGKGAQTRIVDNDGDTALHWAAFKGFNELIRLLVYSGLDPHRRDKYGQTALHLACINGNLISVQELCEQDGAEIDLVDKNGKTPLMLATGRKHLKVIEYLRKRLGAKNNMLPKIDIMSIVFGPPGNHKGPLIFMVVSILFWGYPMYLIKCLPVNWLELQTTHMVFMAMNVVMWLCLYNAATIDPGYLPRNIPEYDRAIKEVVHFEEWKHGGANPLSRLCHTCRTVKPIRSKHCRICNRCVIMFDHHCPYIYNCVGVKNRVWFFGFVTSLFVAGILTVQLCSDVLSRSGWDWLVLIGLVETAFFCFIASIVFLFTIYHMALNLTTNERINHRRYDYLKDGKGKYYNAYDRGWKYNFMEFFHLKRGLSEDQVEFLNVSVV